MPGSSKPQDAASTRNLNADTAVIRAKAKTYPIRREPGRMPGSILLRHGNADRAPPRNPPNRPLTPYDTCSSLPQRPVGSRSRSSV